MTAIIPPKNETLPKAKGRPRSFDRAQALHRALEVFWTRGFGPATMAELCAAMGINPPSLYAAFGNKASLFLEAVEHYETTYWAAPWRRLKEEPDLRRALERFLCEAAAILSMRDVPCGCVVVLATANVAPEAQDICDAMKTLREASRTGFQRRFEQAVTAGDLPPDADVAALAAVFTAVLQGMSVQARDGAPREELERIARTSLAMLPAPGLSPNPSLRTQ